MGQGGALFGCFEAIVMGSRGRLTPNKIADSDMRSGSFSGIAERFADTKRLRRIELATLFFKRLRRLWRLLQPTQIIVGPFAGCDRVCCLLGLVFAILHDMLPATLCLRVFSSRVPLIF